MADKEATIYVVDVSRSMGRSHNGREQSDLDWALTYVWDKITTTVSTGRKTAQIGVIGLGTDETENQMEAEEAYQHISILTPIQQILLPELQRLAKVLKPSKTDERDALSAIIIAVDVMMKHCKHLKFRKKIVLVTNGTGIIDDDDIESTAQQIQRNGIELVVLGIDFRDTDQCLAEGEDKPEGRLHNEETLRKLVDSCGGIIGTMKEAIDDLDRPEMKLVRPMPTYKGQLRLGDPETYDTAITIDVERYFKVSVRRPPTASAFAIRTGPSNSSEGERGLATVHNEYKYFVVDKSRAGNKLELNREDLAKGYEYGRTAVYISETDENITRLETTAGYEIMGFIPMENVERYMLIDNSNMLVAPKGNDKAALALSSLIQALYIQESVVVARFVKKDIADPQITLLSPLVEPDFECLIENVLPFAEDMRTYRFPPLDKVLTVSGKQLTSHRLLPSSELQSAMDDFVDSMSLVGPRSHDSNKDNSGEDEGEKDEEAFALDDTFSPALHTIEGAIKHRAIYPQEPTPPKSRTFMAYSQPPENIQEAAQAAVDRVVKAAEVKKVPAKVKGRRTYRETEKPISGLDIESLFRKEKGRDGEQTRISKNNAIPDFKQALAAPETDAAIKAAFEQMSAIVEEWVHSSFGEQNYERVIEGLGVMRSEAVELEMPDLYNGLLSALKDKVLHDQLGGNRRDFWAKARWKKGLGLIDSLETNGVSAVGRDEAVAFWVLR
ncbi:hypothetical protein DV736_g5308, partial [Chaetothyriales sp. CBS 134916]